MVTTAFRREGEALARLHMATASATAPSAAATAEMIGDLETQFAQLQQRVASSTQSRSGGAQRRNGSSGTTRRSAHHRGRAAPWGVDDRPRRFPSRQRVLRPGQRPDHLHRCVTCSPVDRSSRPGDLSPARDVATGRASIEVFASNPNYGVTGPQRAQFQAAFSEGYANTVAQNAFTPEALAFHQARYAVRRLSIRLRPKAASTVSGFRARSTSSEPPSGSRRLRLPRQPYHPHTMTSRHPWPTPAGTAQEGSTPVRLRGGDVRWSVELGHRLASDIVADAEGRWFARSEGIVVAGDALTVLWRRAANVLRPSILHDGSLVLPCADAGLAVVQPGSGAEVWSVPGYCWSASPTDSDGLAVLVSVKPDWSLLVVESGGAPRWSRSTGIPVAAPLVGDDGTVVSVSKYRLEAFDRDGRVLWNASPAGFETPPDQGRFTTQAVALDACARPRRSGQFVARIPDRQSRGTHRRSAGRREATGPHPHHRLPFVGALSLLASSRGSKPRCWLWRSMDWNGASSSFATLLTRTPSTPAVRSPSPTRSTLITTIDICGTTKGARCAASLASPSSIPTGSAAGYGTRRGRSAASRSALMVRSSSHRRAACGRLDKQGRRRPLARRSPRTTALAESDDRGRHRRHRRLVGPALRSGPDHSDMASPRNRMSARGSSPVALCSSASAGWPFENNGERSRCGAHRTRPRQRPRRYPCAEDGCRSTRRARSSRTTSPRTEKQGDLTGTSGKSAGMPLFLNQAAATAVVDQEREVDDEVVGAAEEAPEEQPIQRMAADGAEAAVGDLKPDAAPLPEVSGTGIETELSAYSLTLRGRTDATFSSSFRTRNVRTSAATGCDNCADSECVHVTGTLESTFRVTTTRDVAERERLSRLDPLPASARARRHYQRARPARATACRRISHATTALSRRHSISPSAAPSSTRASRTSTTRLTARRQSAARAASDALDPFQFDVDLDCQD